MTGGRARQRHGRAKSSPPKRPIPAAPPAPVSTTGPAAALPAWLSAMLALAIAAVIALRYAEPILDGDLYWHLAYARQMIERGTLITDHTLYSWTPTDSAYVYCAWLSELILYALHRIGDLPALFVLRYAIVGAGAALLLRLAADLDVSRRFLPYCAVLLAVLASHASTLVKPELISFLLFHLIVFVYFRAKKRYAAGVAGGGSPGAGRLFFAVPAIVLVWANAHGAFVMAAPFLAATALGEALNRRFAPALALSPKSFRRMMLAWALCGMAVFATPYLWRYPVQLVAEYALSSPRPDLAWNVAHLSIFDALASGLHLAQYGAAMLVVLGFLAWRAARPGGRIDLALLLANLAFVPLFAVYLRTSYFWPILFGYTAIHLVARASDGGANRRRPARAARAARGALAALFLALAVRGVYEARYRPSVASWMGFGTSYVNPVAEAEFLARSELGPRLYNIFDSGGYLLWRLHPKYEVMVDSRSFPYLAWFRDQYAFANGDAFETFLARYPADTAIIDLAKPGAWRNFLKSAEWRVAYYGPTAAVFVKASTDPGRLAGLVEPARFERLLNGGTAARVFDFAAISGDHRMAWRILSQIDERLEGRVDPAWLDSARALRAAHRTLARRDLAAAERLFAGAFAKRMFGTRDRLILSMLREIALARDRGADDDLRMLEGRLYELAVPPD